MDGIRSTFSNSQRDLLYASMALRSCAESLVSIFIPIYLLVLGYPLKSVIVYFIVYYSCCALLMPVSMFANAYLGNKKTMVFGTSVLLVFYYSLSQIGSVHYLLIAMLYGISVSFFYSGYHIAFTSNTDSTHCASQQTMINILMLCGSMMGPLIGAFFITQFSFDALFILVSFILFLSAMPLLYIQNQKITFDEFDLNTVIKVDSFKKSIAYMASGFTDIVLSIFWPVFIYLVLKEVLSLGVLISISSIATAVFLFIIGKITDKHADGVMEVGVVTHSITWITKLLFVTPIGIFLNTFLGSLSKIMIDTSLNRAVYNDARTSGNIGHYFIFREFSLLFGRLSILLMVLLLIDIQWSFLLASIITLTYLSLLKTVKIPKFELSKVVQ